MAELPFNISWLEALADSRIAIVTSIMLIFTFFGDMDFYILVIVLVYWTYNKELGYKLTMIALFASTTNHILKIFIGNPRPFSQDESYKERWAISDSKVEERLAEYSTPSGHAMGAASFWYYFYRKVTNKYTLILMIVMVFLIGFSRPYLGVHYVEDVVIGWIIGLLLAVLVLKYEASIAGWWNKYNLKLQTTIVVVGTMVFIGLSYPFFEWGPNTQTFATNGGILTGIALGVRLERNKLNFDTSCSNIGQGLIRYIVGVILVFATLMGLDAVFGMIAEDDTILGILLRYVRYSSVGIMVAYFIPVILSKLKLLNLLDIKD